MPGVDKQSLEFLKALDAIRAHASIYQGIERVRSRYAGTWKGEALFYAALATHYEEESQEASAWENKRETRIEELEDDLTKAQQQKKALHDALSEIVTAADGAGWANLDPSFNSARKALGKL